MSYIGSTPTSQNFISGTDYFNGTGSQTAFTLTRSVNSVNDVEVVVNNVIQQPNSYTISGTTLTLSAAPSSGTSNVYVRYLATNQQSFTVGNNTVGYNQLTTDMQSKFAMKNRIINGGMVIDQRNAGALVSVSSSQYTLDRFSNDCTAGGGGVYSCQQSSTAPDGFVKSMALIVTTADSSIAAGDAYRITQPIEGFNTADLGWGTASAKTVTLSFWVRSSLIGTYGVGLANNAETENYVATYTISAANTWEQKTITLTGDTAGTWLTNNSTGIGIRWDLGSGTNYNGTANTWQTTGSKVYRTSSCVNWIANAGATFYITGVQLEVGSSATGFEYRQYGQELALCQRYFETTATSGVIGLNETQVQVVFNTAYCTAPQFKITKRTAPTVTIFSRGNTSGQVSSTASGSNVSVATATNISATGVWAIYLTTGQTAYSAGMEAGFTASAEL